MTTADDRPAPFWIIGAPRSGTTYLVEIVNRHPGVFMTNETRIMTYVHRALRRLPHDSMVLEHHKPDVLHTIWRYVPGLVEEVFDELGRPPGVRWGDKNPHYADSKIDPQLLETVDGLYPTGQYVHVVRDGRDAAASMTKKGWVDTEEAIDTWNRHVTTSRSFGYDIGLDRYYELSYERLVADGVAAVAEMLEFLGLDRHADVDEFLEEQERERTPFSRPVSGKEQIGASTWRDRVPDEWHLRFERGLADRLVEFGYEGYAWRRKLYVSSG